MAIVLKPKKSETASAVPTTSDLAVGEICVNVADRKIYTRKSNNSIVVVSSHIDTDVGATSVGGDVTGTVSNIQIGSNKVGITELNVSDGSAGQYLTTNGSGTLSFATDNTNVSGTAVGGDVTGTVSNIQIATNTVGITELNVSDGSAGQYLTTNGSGTLSFATDNTNVSGTAVGGDVTGTVSNIQIATNTVGVTELNVSDGTNGQVLKTNGSGTLSFTTIAAGVSEATATSKAVTMAIALG
jgi:sporulation protein YlmC with PRC-barrel domain|tara:strand:- start:906 stop:1631 length:726 start_codon:yes stop_codon:yes gene_type:complete